MRLHDWLAALSCCVALHAAGAQESFASKETLGQWVTYYYTRPEPARVAEAIASASRLGIFRQGRAAPPFFGFLAGVLEREPAIADAVVRRLAQLPEADQPVVILGVWYSGHRDTGRLLAGLKEAMPAQKKPIEALLRGEAPRLATVSLEEGPWVLDALWGNFMATGDDAPVIRIITALPWVDVRGDKAKMMVGGAAQWSLVSNAVQHDRVLAICRAQLRRQPKEIAKALARVIAQAEEDLAKRKTEGTTQSPSRPEGAR